ncbi:MAG TPA: hypothetical protein VGM39_23470, partial [Kofleriaceae bacterium]
LDLLKITPETELELTTDGTSLLVTPAHVKKRVEKSPTREPTRSPERPAPKAPPKRPEPRYGFPKKQPW